MGLSKVGKRNSHGILASGGEGLGPGMWVVSNNGCLTGALREGRRGQGKRVRDSQKQQECHGWRIQSLSSSACYKEKKKKNVQVE